MAEPIGQIHKAWDARYEAQITYLGMSELVTSYLLRAIVFGILDSVNCSKYLLSTVTEQPSLLGCPGQVLNFGARACTANETRPEPFLRFDSLSSTLPLHRIMGTLAGWASYRQEVALTVPINDSSARKHVDNFLLWVCRCPKTSKILFCPGRADMITFSNWPLVMRVPGKVPIRHSFLVSSGRQALIHVHLWCVIQESCLLMVLEG